MLDENLTAWNAGDDDETDTNDGSSKGDGLGPEKPLPEGLETAR